MELLVSTLIYYLKNGEVDLDFECRVISGLQTLFQERFAFATVENRTTISA